MIHIAGLSTVNFAGLGTRVFNFSPGFSFMIGPNESGKSSIMAAILGVLFGLKDPEKYRPPGLVGGFGAAIKLVVDGKEIKIDRRMDTNDVQIFELPVDKNEFAVTFSAKVSPKGHSQDLAEYRRRLANLIGSADADVILATAIVSPSQMPSDRETAVASLKQLLSGEMAHDHEGVISYLWDQYYELTQCDPTGKKRKNRPRELEKISNQKTDLLKRLERAKNRQTELNATRARLESGSDRLAQANSDHEKVSEKLNLAEQYMKLSEHSEKARSQFDQFHNEKQKMLELLSKKQKHEKELEEHPRIQGIPSSASEKIRRKLGLTARREEAMAELLRLERKMQASSLHALWGILAATAFILMAAAFSFHRWPYWWILGIGAAALLFPLYFLYQWIYSRWAHSRDFTRAIEEIKTELMAIESEIRRLGLPSDLMNASIEELSRVLDELSVRDQTQKEIEVIRGQMEMLPNLEDIDLALANYAREIAVTGRHLAELESQYPELPKIDGRDMIDLVKKQEELESEIERFHETNDQLRTTLATLTVGTEYPESLVESIEELNEREAELRHRTNAIYLAIKNVESAVEDFRGNYLVGFGENVTQMFQSLLENDARTVVMSEKLEPGLQSGGIFFDSAKLSTGTTDQLLLAIRLALLDRLSAKIKIPLLLDDPLVTFDDKRAQATIRLLEAAAKERQIILFTHDRRFISLAGRQASVIELKPIVHQEA